MGRVWLVLVWLLVSWLAGAHLAVASDQITVTAAVAPAKFAYVSGGQINRVISNSTAPASPIFLDSGSARTVVATPALTAALARLAQSYDFNKIGVVYDQAAAQARPKANWLNYILPTAVHLSSLLAFRYNLA